MVDALLVALHSRLAVGVLQAVGVLLAVGVSQAKRYALPAGTLPY